MLVQTIDLNSDIIDAQTMFNVLKRACQVHGVDNVQVRLGAKTDNWGQTLHHMKICCYQRKHKQ